VGQLGQTLNILAFGQASLFCGGSSFQITTDLPISVQELRELVHARFPIMPVNFMVAVNLEYAANDRMISSTDLEIAIIPPVSGG
jgi:molybdopterin converting factor small subunit